MIMELGLKSLLFTIFLGIILQSELTYHVYARDPTATQPLGRNTIQPLGRNGKRRPPPSPLPPPPPYVPTFDLFTFSLTWPPTFCKITGNKCIDQVPRTFKIHGLWPNKRNSEPMVCTGKPINQEQTTVILKNSGKKLAENWPNLIKEQDQVLVNNWNFWNREWNKHGNCSAELFDAIEYFAVALNLYDKVQVMNYLKAEGIEPKNKMVDKLAILAAIQKHIGFQPQIQCRKFGNEQRLLEVRICYTASKEPTYINCDSKFSDCPDNVMIF